MAPKTDSPGFMEIMEELRKFKGNDRSTVLITCGYIELLAEILISEKCKNRTKIEEDRRSYPFSAKLLLLNEIGAIEDSLYRHLDRFRKLRNQAAHDAIFLISDTDKKHFIRVKGATAPSLGEHCIALLFLFWKAQSDIFNRQIYAAKKNA
jgi:hypothetical protein